MEIQTIDEVKIIQICPRIDASNAKTVELKLVELVNAGGKKIVCDFKDNEYISSAGLRVFLTMLKMLQKSGGSIVLCTLQPYVKEVFDMAGFSQLFKIYGNVEEAIQGIR